MGRPVPEGQTITVVLDLKDGQGPLSLSGALVKWSNEESFGVKFPALTHDQRKRLQELVLKFVSLEGGNYTAFRIA